MQICPGHSPSEPAVANYFFEQAKFQGALLHSDQVTLAIDGGIAVVGAVLVRNGKVLCVHADTQNICRHLLKNIRAAN